MTSEKLTNIVLQNQIITQTTSQSQNFTTITNDTPKSFLTFMGTPPIILKNKVFILTFKESF